MGQLGLQFGPPSYSVTEITAAIRQTLQDEFRGVWVDGEITEAKLAPSGHWYFSLKDASAKIKCVCYRGNSWKLRVKPADGLQVRARGSVDLYEARGECQFIVEALQPRGFGELQLAFEQLKQRLDAEGLFAADRKRAIPPYPRRIGIITSPSGAAVQDLVQVLTRRFPGLHIRIYPAQVQGVGSSEQVIAGLAYFSTRDWADVVILARGGGSLEDLWTFNEESVARAIAASTIPVVSAIGHETDFTIADFVADLRAPTPSAAAELVVPTLDDLSRQLTHHEARLTRTVGYRLARLSERLHRLGVDRARASLERRIGRGQQRMDELDFRMRDAVARQIRSANTKGSELRARLTRQDPRMQLTVARHRLDRATSLLSDSIHRRVTQVRNRLASLETELTHLSPVAILSRGYAIVQRSADGSVIKSPAQAPPGESLRIRLGEGAIQAEVTRSEPE